MTDACTRFILGSYSLAESSSLVNLTCGGLWQVFGFVLKNDDDVTDNLQV